ncbi:MAG TPA: phosphopantetheine-binding protein [Acidimicrobiales bacterium]|nr:phosphopantetheine-binding protein [Acidimicrobiales bacterium]
MARADLSFDAFAALVAEVAGVAPDAVTKDAVLWDELGFDSLRMVELMVAVADAGVLVPEDVADGVDTVGQAYDAISAVRPAGTEAPQTSATALETRRLRLRPVVLDDHPFLYELATSPHIGWRLKSRGLPLSYDEFVAQLHRDVLAQMMVDDVRSAQRVGIVQAVAGNLIDGHARVTATARPERIGSGWALEGLGLFVSYLFATFPLRKLYAEVPSFAWPTVVSGEGSAFSVEGVLKGHRYANGQWWDVSVVAIDRDGWAAWGEPRVQSLRSPATPQNSREGLA